MTLPKVFFLRNHSASELHSAELASLATAPGAPAFPDKEAFARWCHSATTEHCFYSLAEPGQPGLRASGSNPVKFLHGIVADYDGSPEAIQAALPTLRFAAGKAPTWVTKTFSGKARLIWAFERPVPTFTPDILTRALAILAKDLRLKGLLPGLDEGALENPFTPYELGTEWRQPYGDVRLPSAAVVAAFHEASDKAKWKASGPVIPMNVVHAEVARRWPGRWPGPFEPGAKGIRFWDARADNPTGCTLRAEGVQAWTGECRFLAWLEVLGAEFCRQYQVNRIGGAIEGTYYDGKDYYQRDANSRWRALSGDTLKRHLNVLHGLSAESKKGHPSEVATALTTVDVMHTVDGAFPCLFMRDDIVRDGTQTYLNISRSSPIPALSPGRGWGDGFPWLGEYLTALFSDRQREVFLSWLRHFYVNALKGAPRKGHALFVAGGVSAGKTFLSQRVVGGLMGGFQEATQYVLGNTSFNEQLFHSPVWAVDDAVASADPRRHTAYSQFVKKIVANPYQEFHPKFKKAVTFRWNGRLIITLNADPESLSMLPNTDGSILDKFDLLHARDHTVSFTDADDNCSRELPAFADFVAGYRIPDWLQTRPDEVSRFGHDSWHDDELIQIARESNSSASIGETVAMWRELYFRVEGSREWRGSAERLWSDMNEMDTIKDLLKVTARSPGQLGKNLQKLIAQGTPWLGYTRTGSGRQYVITRQHP